MVTPGKGSTTKPNTPMAHAQRARILVRFGRALHMQDHMVFGLVWGVGLPPTVDVGLQVCGIGQARHYQ